MLLFLRMGIMVMAMEMEMAMAIWVIQHIELINK
jgi:hypothetical protein